jgi:hypothetical protein
MQAVIERCPGVRQYVRSVSNKSGSEISAQSCAYSADGGTQGRLDGGCGAHWCTRAVSWECSWRPTDLQAMMETQEEARANTKRYNEVILLPRLGWEARLPGLVEAIFFVASEDKARRVHADFLRRFGARWVPLLRLDLGSSERPFTYVPV